jgi:hypothetical protein
MGRSRREALKIKGFVEMPAKKANANCYINQQLRIAIGFVASPCVTLDFCGVASKFLCISQASK